jgi:DNA-binding NarL/FixJ family response regulator
MIRTLVVADSGTVLSTITASLCRVDGVDIVAYASGRAHLDEIVRAVGADVVLVDEMRRPGIAVQRIAEVRGSDPSAIVVGLTDRPDSRWVIDALRAGAATVVPRDLQPATLGLVLREVLGKPAPAALPVAERRAAA